jgi:Na+-translocating ferredoxin:NAD+ oxidoreductase RnfG subunit
MSDSTASYSIARGIGFLASVGLACAGLLYATQLFTAERIAHNASVYEARQITALVGVEPTTEPQWIDNVWPMCDGIALVRAQIRGYGGPISALVARDGRRLRGLRVTAHHETPGIADFVSRPADPWRAAVRGRTGSGLAEVDAVAGATITSRALTTLLADALDRPVPHAECPP